MTARLARVARLLGHVTLGAVALAWIAVARRGATLVLTHAPDVDADGRDRQMGPLLEELARRGRPVARFALVPLAGGRHGLVAELRRARAPFVPHAFVRVLARLLGEARAGRLLVRTVAPRVAFLIDESGSGQVLLRGARALGVPVVGVQHGDFQPTNAQYSAPGPEVEPADALAVWSPFFRERLLAISPLYGTREVRVVGRLAHGEGFRRAPVRPAGPTQPAGPTPGRETLEVLLVSERGVGFPGLVAPFVAAVRAAHDLRLLVRPHPGEPPGVWPEGERSRGTLEEDLARSSVVCGIGSSALLEALAAGRPAVVLGAGDPAGYVAARVARPCERPEDLPGLVRALAAAGEGAVREAAQRVWGLDEGEASPAARLVELGEALVATRAQPAPGFRPKARTRAPRGPSHG